MRKSVLTGLFACAIVFAKASTASAETLNQEIKTNNDKTVVELLSFEPSNTLSVLTLAIIEKPVEEPKAPEVVIHKVAKDETLSDIAKLHNVDWKRLFDKNINLADPDIIEVDLELIIPALEEVIEPRELPATVPIISVPAKDIKAPATTTVSVTPKATTSGNGYVAGYCTWYVKNRRPDLPNNLGNASSWVSNASKQGLSTGSTPAVGAVGQRNNHVVYVESINGDGTITISDMNHQALYEITTRVVNASDFRYIY
jgi:LysM repeat protein